MGGTKITKLCIDLCSGLGGFSKAFAADSEWEVVTVDIDAKFNPTIIADVNHLPFRQNLKPDCLLMSPPCERFSLMSNAWPKFGIKKALETVGSCLEAVAWLQPKKWLLENPKGRLRWFIGIPRQSIRYSDYDFSYKVQKPTDLWGNIMLPLATKHRPVRTKLNGRHMKNFYQCYISDSSKSAMIPMGVSKAVKDGCENKDGI